MRGSLFVLPWRNCCHNKKAVRWPSIFSPAIPNAGVSASDSIPVLSTYPHRSFGILPPSIPCGTDSPREKAGQEEPVCNGGEFTHTQKTDRVHPLDALCSELHIVHKTIRPRTPWHNGKVERSHRNDQERFYNHLKFYSYEDLQLQMKRYLRRANRIPMAILGWKSPIQKRQELEDAARFC